MKLKIFRPSQRSSPAATDRLMKDLKSIYKSDSYKKELYTVKLPDDNVYEWRVALVCPFKIQSPLQLRDPFSSLFVILSTKTVD